MTKHEAAVAWLEKNVGQHESPMGSNTGPFVQECQAATWLAGSHWPWCVATWVKAWTVAGYKLPYKGAGAYSMLDWYRAHCPAWVVPVAKAEPGAAVILNIGSGHCATLAKKYDGGTIVHCVDGNWDDAVTRTTHPVSLIRGVVDPPEKPLGKIPAVKRAKWEVVTSASGHSKLIYAGGEKAIQKKLGKFLNANGGVTIRRRKKQP